MPRDSDARHSSLLRPVLLSMPVLLSKPSICDWHGCCRWQEGRLEHCSHLFLGSLHTNSTKCGLCVFVLAQFKWFQFSSFGCCQTAKHWYVAHLLLTWCIYCVIKALIKSESEIGCSWVNINWAIVCSGPLWAKQQRSAVSGAGGEKQAPIVILRLPNRIVMILNFLSNQSNVHDVCL